MLSVPVKLLKEGEGHVVTAELKSGDVYRGLLVESEDTMNVQLSEGENDDDDDDGGMLMMREAWQCILH